MQCFSQDVSITIINLAAGVTDIYHLSSQYPWFRIVPKTYLNFMFSIPRCKMKKRGCWEREIWKVAGIVPVFRCELSNSMSSGILDSSLLVLVLDHHFHEHQLDGDHGRPAWNRECFQRCIDYLLLKLIWLIFSLLADLLTEKCRIYYCQLINLTSKSLWFMIFFLFMFHNQLYRYKHF